MTAEYPEHAPYSVEYLKTLFTNKRRTYRKEKKKVSDTKSGQALAEGYSGKWKYFHAMKFLENITQRGPRFVSGADGAQGTVDELGDLSNANDVPDSVSNVPLESTQLPLNEEEEDQSSATEDSKGTMEDAAIVASTNAGKPCRIRRPQDTCETSDEMFAQLQALLENIAKGIQPEAPDDPATHFGRYVASLMKKMSLSRQLMCQEEIIAVLQEYVVDQ
ncbi:hypothetical protein HPB52_019576 [Rhipicephalus sanguineus]|uniref:MADF domain-containing protein n=1 Tax=Rhipicephalus sanguineus TaxID=34632 RepID=A0A9D4PSD4_RHISA|nr:hypothetical protein HPB52_019576 [Rhipicephalus sanguineus]